MSRARRMQEFKYFRGGASLVVSLDGLNWLCKRRCRDKGIKKRDDDLQLWISAGHVIQADEELQPITCLCICGLRASAAPHSRMNKAVTQSSSSSRHCCLLEGPEHQSAFTPPASLTSEWPTDAPWTRLILNMPDIFRWITKDLNTVIPQKSVKMNQQKKLIIFCNEEIPSRLFCDYFHSQDCRTSLGITGCHINNNSNMTGLLKTPTAHRPHNPNNNNLDKHSSELMARDNIYTCSIKRLSVEACQNYGQTGEYPERKRNKKKRKSVSFADDVVVYLFDQESPTLELHPEPCSSTPLQSSYSSDVTFDDSGLEWEDDFSALEKNCHFRYFSHSMSHNYTFSLPTPSWTALCRPERFYLSQTCLFLTHVTEADLDL